MSLGEVQAFSQYSRQLTQPLTHVAGVMQSGAGADDATRTESAAPLVAACRPLGARGGRAGALPALGASDRRDASLR